MMVSWSPGFETIIVFCSSIFSGFPLKSVTIPPNSSTNIFPAAKSHGAKRKEICASSLPAATEANSIAALP